jgi:Fe-S oxidoreductase
MALKDFTKEIERCSACSYCKWIPLDHVKSWRFAKNCPSIDYFNFNSYSARGRYLTSRSILRDELEITDEVMDIAHTCLSCGACDVACKICRYNLEPLEMTRELKADLVKRGKFPEGQKTVLNNLKTTANCFGESRKSRADWAKGLGIKDLTKESAEVVLHVGCSYSYDERLTETVKTAVEILNKAGIDFGIMGNAEMCCGAKVHSMGHYDEFERLAKANIKLWQKAGVKTVITACSDGYHAIRRLYPELDSNFKVMHIVECIDLLIRDGKLKFTKKVPMKVTYHDPCHLGRQGEPYVAWNGVEKKFKNQIVVHEPRKPRYNGIDGIYDEPRNILKNIPGIELEEMERIKEYSYCCGAGGGARESYPEYSSWVAGERLEEAASTGAEALITACPWCKTNFSNSKGDTGSMNIIDILDLVRMAL